MKNSTLKKDVKKEKIDLFISIEFILCFFIVYFTVARKTNLASICFTCSFIVLLVLFFKSVFTSKLKNKEFVYFGLLILILFIGFISVIYSNLTSSLSFEYFKKYLIFCSTVIFLFVINKIEISKRTVKFILIINIILGCFYTYSFYYGGGRAYYSEYGSRYLTFNFTSPNLTAMWLLVTILYIFMAIVILKSKIVRLFCIALLVPMIYFLYKTEARTSLIVLVLYFVLVSYVIFKKNIRFNKLTIIILILLPILLAVLYMFMIYNDRISILNFMASEGKSVSSRQSVWGIAFDVIKAYPILGSYYLSSGGLGIPQMHNTHLDIWSSYGTVTFVLLMIYLIRISISISQKCTSKIQTIGLIAFFATITIGMGEAALFSGGQGIYILGCSFLLIAKFDSNNN